MKKFGIILIAIFLILVSTEFTLAQCAMCRATVETNLSEGRGVIGTGINFGILYLLSAPYLLVGGLFLFWYRSAKKVRAERLALDKQLSDIYNK